MKILIIRLSSIGDIILTQPVVMRLREVFPEAEIHYLTKAEYGSLPLHFGAPIKVIHYRKTFSFHYSLMKSKYDYVFDLHAKFSTFLVKLAIGYTINFTYRKQHRLRKAIVNHKTDKQIRSTLDLYGTALITAGRILDKKRLTDELEYPRLIIGQPVKDEIKTIFSSQDGKWIVALCPGAAHYTKKYPQDKFTDVIRLSGDKYYFLLLGSNNERNITADIHSATKDMSVDLSGKYDLADTIAILSLADIVITNDSGMMHIAAALEKPQLAIFGATHPKLGFRPLNDKAVIICKNLTCQPCSLHGSNTCPQEHFNCMKSISPDEIVDQLKHFQI